MAKEVPDWRGVTLNEVGTSELRKRNTPNHATEEESVWTLKVRAVLYKFSNIEIDTLAA